MSIFYNFCNKMIYFNTSTSYYFKIQSLKAMLASNNMPIFLSFEILLSSMLFIKGNPQLKQNLNPSKTLLSVCENVS